MPRLLVLCEDTPYAARWVADEARRLATDRAVKSLRCHRVLPLGPCHPRWYDWLIEIELSNGNRETVADDGWCAELLDDLQLSGARPIALLIA